MHITGIALSKEFRVRKIRQALMSRQYSVSDLNQSVIYQLSHTIGDLSRAFECHSCYNCGLRGYICRRIDLGLLKSPCHTSCLQINTCT